MTHLHINAIHCINNAGIENRFDTLLTPNGGVAALLELAHQHSVSAVGIDEGYTGTDEPFIDTVRTHIDAALQCGKTPLLLCTVLSYNAQATDALLATLKQEYGSRIRTCVGGQLIRCAPHAWIQKKHVDQIVVGDAEATFAAVLTGQSFIQGWTDEAYAPFRFYEYLGFSQRLDAMEDKRLGPFTGIRQSVLESSRGCAWAYSTGAACRFCSLQSITDKPRVNWAHIFEQERQLIEQWNVNWVFDVANQWLPTLARKESWLEQFLKEREKWNLPALQRYVYLTSNSITPTTAPLLADAEVRIAYVGLDGWNTQTLQAHHKIRYPTATLVQACKQSGIFLRAGLVIGEGAVNQDSLTELMTYARWLVGETGDLLISLACYPVVVLPDSAIWYTFLEQAKQQQLPEVLRLYKQFDAQGFHTRDQEREMTRLFMLHSPVCGVTLDEAEAVTESVATLVEERAPHSHALLYENKK